MTGQIFNTDERWLAHLRRRSAWDEVNFWLPSDTRRKHMLPGAPFFFKLKARFGHAVAGFGFFQRHVVLPLWLAWESFGEANGAASFQELQRRVAGYRSGPLDPLGQYPIGCLLISDPVFFADEDRVAGPSDWARSIVQGKQLDLEHGEGRRIWQACQLHGLAAGKAKGVAEASLRERYGAPQLVRPRLGQGGFRIAVTEAYRRSCAVTREHSLPVLEAAHIRPYAETGEHATTNGLLLRADIHKLYDRGYVTVTEDHRFVVSRRLKDDYENGKVYYEMQGRTIQLPESLADRPDPAALRWHNERAFVG
jgi:putative restriction endonuclease